MARTYHTFDVIIIGGGTAGLSALKEAKKYTNNVLLVHDGKLGTTCARTGCMPSKALIHAASLYNDRKRMKTAGINGTESLTPDIPEILERVREKRDYFIASVKEGMAPLNSHIIKGHCRLESPNSVRADNRLLHAKSIIIATGASPIIPDELKDFTDKIITSDNLFEQKDLPKRIGVVGLGPIGLEIGQAFARLGIEVTAIEHGTHIGGIADKDISHAIHTMLKKDMRVWLNTKMQVARAGDALLLKGPDNMVEVDALFIATGTKPNVGGLGLRRLNIPMCDKGIPHHNRFTMQVPGFPLYLAGDVTDERAVLHEAADEGKRAGYYAVTNGKNTFRRKVELSIIFTHPNIAVIGDSSYAMRTNGVVIGEASFKNQGRATLEDKNEGKIRLAADKETGLLRGCELMAPEGEHLAHLLALAMEQRLSAKKMLDMPFYHPTLEEGLKTALKDVCAQL